MCCIMITNGTVTCGNGRYGCVIYSPFDVSLLRSPITTQVAFRQLAYVFENRNSYKCKKGGNRNLIN